MVDDVFEERDVGLDAANAELAERAVHTLASFGKFCAPRRHFYQERIVVGGQDRAGIGGAAVETNSKSRRGPVGRKLSVVGSKIIFGIFGGDAALQGRAVEWHVCLFGQREGLLVKLVALRNQNLRADQVDAG